MSLEDEVVHDYFKGRTKMFSKLFRTRGKPLPAWLAGFLVGAAQRGTESRHGLDRRELLRNDEQLSDLLAFTGRGE